MIKSRDKLIIAIAFAWTAFLFAAYLLNYYTFLRPG